MDKNVKNGVLNNAWFVCFIASLFFFYEFIQMSVFNAIGEVLLKYFSINVTSLANIAAAYYYSLVLFLLPAGVLLDFYSPKKIMLIAFSLSVIGTFLFTCCNDPLYAEFCRMLSGIGGAFAFLSCIKIISCLLPGRKMSLAVGLLVTMAFLGGAIAQTPFTILVQKYGWEVTLRIFSFFGLTAILLISIFVKDASNKFLAEQERRIQSKVPFFKRVVLSLLNIQTWLVGIYIMLMNLPIVLLGSLWGVFYLTEVRLFDRIQASYITTMLFFGMMIGSPIFGFISSKLARKKSVLFFGALLTLISSLFLFESFSSIVVYMAIFFSLGFFSSAQGIGYPTMIENNPIDLSGTVSGVASIIIMGGGALFKVLYGWILSKNWHGKMFDKIPLYSHHAFNDAMMILPVSLLVGLVATSLIKETFCKIKC